MSEFYEEDLKDYIVEKYESPVKEKITMFFQGDYRICDFDDDIEEYIKSEEDSFQEKLFSLIREKNLSEVDVYSKANITRQHFSKIRSDICYQPTKMTVVFLALAMELSYDEVMDLLNRAGLTLSHSNKRDLVIEYFICHKIYDIFLLTECMDKYH